MARAAVAGAGIVRLPFFIVEEELGRGELVEILADRRTKPYAPTPHPCAG